MRYKTFFPTQGSSCHPTQGILLLPPSQLQLLLAMGCPPFDSSVKVSIVATRAANIRFHCDTHIYIYIYMHRCIYAIVSRGAWEAQPKSCQGMPLRLGFFRLGAGAPKSKFLLPILGSDLGQQRNEKASYVCKYIIYRYICICKAHEPPTHSHRKIPNCQPAGQPARPIQELSRNKQKRQNHEKGDSHYVYNGFIIKTIKMVIKT